MSETFEEKNSPLCENDNRKTGLFAGLRIVSSLTLVSRVLGLVRDMGMAALFGNGAVMDAFSVAFRVPNMARRLFGEGALSTAFLPVFVRELNQSGDKAAWKLASTLLFKLTLILTVLVLLGELALGAVAWFLPLSCEGFLLVGLTATMLPYLVLICLAAQVCAILHALGHFTWPAALPIVLNVVWLGCLWWVATEFASAKSQIYLLAGSVLLGGILQLAVPVPKLLSYGFRFQVASQETASQIKTIYLALLPIIFGLSITQINTLADSLIAWSFSAPEVGGSAMNLPGSPQYPIASGTASALYFGQRMYQFPLGVFAVALGTVLFPKLTHHAENRRIDLLKNDLSLGLKLVMCIGIPASCGLVLMAEPLANLLFRHGSFDAIDAAQTTAMIRYYGCGVWAYSGLLIVQRGFYAMGDRTTPLRIGLWAILINLVFSFTLIWYIGGKALALSTVIAASIQLLLTLRAVQKKIGRLNWRELFGRLVRVLIASAMMSVACWYLLSMIEDSESLWQHAWKLLAPIATGFIVYSLMTRVLKIEEFWSIFKSEQEK